ncbi:MAG: hypothetical protein K6G81_12320 [Lachnospiraceae bacterium]|nr:hypothetical protein [Lachnospiraceae bacterium]
MNSIRIYRGTNQIGGIVTEFLSEDHRILIDFGANLPGTKDAQIKDDELVEMVFGDKEHPRGADAVLVTHYHGDHVGLKDRIPEDVDMYIGDTAKEILKAIATRVDTMNKLNGNNVNPEVPLINRMKGYWKNGTPKDFSGIRVTPLLCDHSAIDAYMFLIEMNGRRILYTGDFREHGIPGTETFENTIKNNVGKIDILVTEGTMIFRTKEVKDSAVKDEDQLGKEAYKIFNAHKENVVLVSSTNLDSIMEFYHATPSDKAFLCDPYQAEIMKLAIEARNSYYPDKYSYKKTIYVLCKEEYDGCMKNLKDIINPNNGLQSFFMAKPEIYMEQGFVMLARPNRNPKLKVGEFEKRMQQMKDPFITYSLWEGYLEGGKAPDKAITDFVRGRDDESHMKKLHTSGHAYVETLAKLMDMTNPEVIIPMHTESAKAFKTIPQFAAHADKIHVLHDGEVFTLKTEVSR